MSTLVIDNRRYACPDRWTELEWQQLRSVMAYADGRSEQEKSRAATRMLNRIGSVEWRIARQTELRQRLLFADLYTEKIRRQMSAETFPATTAEATEAGGRTEQTEKEPGKEQRSPPAAQERSFLRSRKTATALSRRETGTIRRPNRGKHNKRQEKNRRKSRMPADHFAWNGRRLFYPRAERGFDGGMTWTSTVSAVELCEATDLYLQDKWAYAPLIVAVLCRPKGEAYDERTACRRARQMQHLPVRVILHVFGLLNALHAELRRKHPLCYGKGAAEERSGQDAGPLWNDLLMWAAGYVPGEIERVRRMACGDLMFLVQSRIEFRESFPVNP